MSRSQTDETPNESTAQSSNPSKGRGITALDVEEIEEDGTDGQTDQDRHRESGTGDMNTVPTDSTWNFRQDKQRRSARTVGD